jgi:catechol 2,3-dioxygenase-like lactoylglutathione lyase family enzyme
MRLQLGLNVQDLDEAIDFYSKMFGTTPAKIKPGYANFAIENPPLKLVLFEAGGEHPEASDDAVFHHLNHLGVETESAGQVTDAETRLTASGLDTTGVQDTQCCFAEKTETWVTSPEGARWEWYVKNADSEQFENVVLETVGGSGNACCS